MFDSNRIGYIPKIFVMLFNLFNYERVNQQACINTGT